MTYVPYPTIDPIANIAAHFKKNNALDQSHAIDMDYVDWNALGIHMFDERRILKIYPYIKKTSNNKFWLDPTEMERITKNNIKQASKFFLYFVGFIILFIAVIILIGVFSNI